MANGEQKQESATVSGWVPGEVARAISEAAERDDRSVSYVVSQILQQWYERRSAQKGRLEVVHGD